jgi:hypothetical protein
MSQDLSLGAFNKQTGEYVYPKIANKRDEYICTECNKDLILCQGEIIRPYFRHKVDSVNPCHNYSNPTESQIHKDGKMVMKSLLERKIPISFTRICCSCKKNEEYEIPEMTESSNIELEHRFEYNGTKIADVAYTDNGDIFCIFEIYHTHKTRSENRPEPWFEIDAETLIKLANNNSISHIKMPCVRCENCDDCIEKDPLHSKTKREIEQFKTDVMISKKLKGYGLTYPFNFSPVYKYKHQVVWGYTGDLLEFVINCDMFLSEYITTFENEIYNANELYKKKFHECYYIKYHSAILNIRRYGKNFQYLSQEWHYDDVIKQCMYTFIKHYKLINPVTLQKYLKTKFSV